MQDQLADLHAKTYDTLAQEYESRVEILRPVTERALSLLTGELKPGARVLDVGCAVGYTLDILRQQGVQPEGVDISPAMVALARQRNPGVNVRCGDFFELEYDEQSYDAVLLYAFIHLFPRNLAITGVRKVSRLLKPEGLMFISTTKSDSSHEGFERKSDYSGEAIRFRKRWTRQEFEQLIDLTGFDIVQVANYTDELGKVWMDYVVRKRS